MNIVVWVIRGLKVRHAMHVANLPTLGSPQSSDWDASSNVSNSDLDDADVLMIGLQ